MLVCWSGVPDFCFVLMVSLKQRKKYAGDALRFWLWWKWKSWWWWDKCNCEYTQSKPAVSWGLGVEFLWCKVQSAIFEDVLQLRQCLEGVVSHTHEHRHTQKMHDFCPWLKLWVQTVSCYWNQYFIAIFFGVHILKLSSKYYWKNLLLPAQVVIFLWGLHYIFSFILGFCAGVTISKCELKVCSLISFSKPCSYAENFPHMCRHMSLI